MVSYRHMHTLALAHGEVAWTAALIPLSVDGMIVASSMSLLLDSRSGLRGGLLPWVLLLVGSIASLAANMAVAEPTVYGRVIAAWPSLALIGAYELLMRQIRNRPPLDQAAQSAAEPQEEAKPDNRPFTSVSRASSPADSSPARPPVDRQGEADTVTLRHARQINADHWAQTGRPVSAETLRIQLRIGATSARALRDHLRQEARTSQLANASPALPAHLRSQSKGLCGFEASMEASALLAPPSEPHSPSDPEGPTQTPAPRPCCLMVIGPMSGSGAHLIMTGFGRTSIAAGGGGARSPGFVFFRTAAARGC